METQTDIGYNVRMNKERRRELDRLRKARKRQQSPEFYAQELARNRIRSRLRYIPMKEKLAGKTGRVLGRCEICRRNCRGRTKMDVLHFDHCHKTNRHRGWLCRSCNLLLGYAKDSPKILLDAVRYIRHNRV